MTLSTSTVTLAPGSSRTYTLAPGEAVTVATEPNCYVTVTETPDVISSADLDGQTNVRKSILQYKGTWTYGPYALGGTVAVAVSLSKSTSSVAVTLGSAAAAVVGAAGQRGSGTTRAEIQAALNRGYAYIPGGNTLLDECLLIGSNTAIEMAPSAVITSSGTVQHTMLRTGNAEFSASATAIPGVTIYCADEVPKSGTGTLRYTHATTSLAWLAPDAASYGSEVNIGGVTTAATVAIFEVPGVSAGQSIYVYVAPATRSGVISRTVRLEPVTGARAVTWTRTSNVRTVFESGHQRRRGDFVIIFGDTIRHGYITSVKADHWTIDDAGTDQGTDQSAKAFGVRSISICCNGAQLDYNKGGLATGLMSNLHAVILLAISSSRVDVTQINNATKYAVLVTGYNNVTINDLESYRTDSSDLSGNSDVLHLLGPGRNLRAEGTRAQGGDNVIGVGCADYYDYVFNCPQYGDLSLTGGRVIDTICEDTDQHPVRFYNANRSNVIRNWVVDGVSGTYSTAADACVAIIMDTMSGGMVDAGATNIDGLTVISPDAVRADGSASYAFINRGAGTRRNIRVQRIKPRAGINTARATCWIEGGSSIADLTTEFESGEFSGYLVGLTGTASVGRLTVSSNGTLTGNNELGATQRPVVVALDSSTSALTRLNMQGLELDDSSGSGTKICGVLNNGTISDVLISDVRMLDGDALYRHTITAAAAQTIRLRNITAVADHVAIYDGGAPAQVDLNAVWHNRVANALFAVNDPTARNIRVRAVNCRAGNRFLRNIQGGHVWYISGHGNEPGSGGAFVVDAGAPSVRLDGDWDLVTDGALLDSTVTNHRAGAKFYNSNASFGAGVGAYVRGASAWVRVAS